MQLHDTAALDIDDIVQALSSNAREWWQGPHPALIPHGIITGRTEETRNQGLREKVIDSCLTGGDNGRADRIEDGTFCE